MKVVEVDHTAKITVLKSINEPENTTTWHLMWEYEMNEIHQGDTLGSVYKVTIERST